MTWLVPAVIGSFVNSVSAWGDPRGWGDNIRWASLYEAERQYAVEESEAAKKPIIVFVHKESCPACRFLKSGFSRTMQQDKAAAALSDKFIMVNVVGPELAQFLYSSKVFRRNFYPDGDYVPRVLFFDSPWILNRKLTNGESGGNRFNYDTPSDIVDNMKRMLSERKQH